MPRGGCSLKSHSVTPTVIVFVIAVVALLVVYCRGFISAEGERWAQRSRAAQDACAHRQLTGDACSCDRCVVRRRSQVRRKGGHACRCFGCAAHAMLFLLELRPQRVDAGHDDECWLLDEQRTRSSNIPRAFKPTTSQLHRCACTLHPVASTCRPRLLSVKKTHE